MAYNTIKIKKYSDVIEEIVAAAAITPGMVLELTSAGKVQAHSTAGGNVLPVMVALEDDLQGYGIDDAYAAAAQVQVWIPGRGDVVYATLEDGETLAIGDPVESAGNGNVQKHTADTETVGVDSSGNITTIYSNQIIGVAIEAKDLSGSSGEESSGLMGDQRVLIRIV